MDNKYLSADEFIEKATVFLNRHFTDLAKAQRDGSEGIFRFDHNDSEIMFNLLIFAYAALHIDYGPKSQLIVNGFQSQIGKQITAVKQGEADTINLGKINPLDDLAGSVFDMLKKLMSEKPEVDPEDLKKVLEKELPDELNPNKDKPKPDNPPKE